MDTPASPAVEAVPARKRGDATTKQIRGSSLLLVGRLVSLGMNMATQVLVVRYLSKTDYGSFAYALSIVSIGQTIATFGLDRAITRFVPIYDERGEYGKVFGTIVMVVGTISSIGLAMVLLVVGLSDVVGDSLIDDRQAITLLLIMVALAPIQAIDSLLTGMFAVFSKPSAIFFRKNVLAPVLRLTVVLLLILFGAGVGFLAGGYVVAGAFGVGLYVVFLARELRAQGFVQHFHFRTMQMPAREVFAFTIPLLSSDLLYVVMHVSDTFLLGYFGGRADVGAFRAVWPVAHMNQLVLTSFALLFTPLAARLFARGDRDGIRDLYWTTAIYMAVFSFPIFALTFSMARPVTVALFEARYQDSATYLALLSFGYYFNAALGHNGLTLKVFGRLRYIVTINVLAAVANIAVALVLIPRYGALGAAIGTCATLVAHNFLKQAGLRLGTGINLFEWRYLKVYLSITVAAGGLLVAQLAFSLNIGISLALALLASALVLALNRSSLRVGDRFPELQRFRLIRLAVGE